MLTLGPCCTFRADPRPAGHQGFIVFGLVFLLSVGVKALASPVEDENWTLHSVTGVIGSPVSGVFRWILGILNLVVLVGIITIELIGVRTDKAGIQTGTPGRDSEHHAGLPSLSRLPDHGTCCYELSRDATSAAAGHHRFW
jgi:hypothetical protein